jgi:anhydro-N-acetylmuramic acid kinase
MRLRELGERPERLVVGMMTGSSMDGLDLVLCRVTRNDPGRFVLLANQTEAFPEALRAALLAGGDLSLAEAARLHRRLGEWFAQATARFLRSAGLTAELVGMHGQTVYHEHGYVTVQLGDPAFLALALRCPVVSDFRAQDIAAGGCGAPLIPIVDSWLFGRADEAVLCLNLGGISNITALVPGSGSREIAGFDCGPGNMVLDELARRFTAGALACDRDGEFAIQGQVRGPWLERALAHPFFALEPPRSAGREQFGAAFVDELLSFAAPESGQDWHDLFATATALTVGAVVASVERFVSGAQPFARMVVAGGGARNPALMGRLCEAMRPVPVLTSDELGVPGSLKEAIAFALLASARIDGIPANVPAVTGARHPVLLGKITEV